MKKRLPELMALVREVQNSDSEQAYERLFKLLFPQLKRFAQAILKSRELSEEVAGDVMIGIWRRRHQLEGVENIQVYSLVTARNLCLNLLRKKMGRNLLSLDEIDVELVFESSDPEQILLTEELNRKLEGAVQALPARGKMVFKLIKEEGLSYREAAEVLNISVKTVDAHLVTAVRKISEYLKKEFNLA